MNAIQQNEHKSLVQFKGELDKKCDDLYRNVIPSPKMIDRFKRCAFSYMVAHPEYLNENMFDKRSLFQALLNAAVLGIAPEPTYGEGYLLPFRDGKSSKQKIQFIPGYEAYLQMAIESPKIRVCYAKCVHKNDVFDISYGSNAKLIHKPTITGDRGEVIGAYLYMEYANGSKFFEFLPLKEILRIRDQNSSGYRFNPKNNPWTTNPEKMYCKTVIRYCKPYFDKRARDADAIESAAERGERYVFNEEGVLHKEDEEEEKTSTEVIMEADITEVEEEVHEEKPVKEDESISTEENETKEKGVNDRFYRFLEKNKDSIEFSAGSKEPIEMGELVKIALSVLTAPLTEQSMNAIAKNPEKFIGKLIEKLESKEGKE